jgi:putative hydrolase of the HAD superfamily
MNKWQAVIFDMDDTLYAERDYVLSGFRAVALWGQAHLGIPFEQGNKELLELFEQGIRGTTFNQWLSQHQLPDSHLSECIKTYREHIPILQPFPWVIELLATLRNHTKLGLISDGYTDVQKRKFAALGLHPYFDAVVFSDELGREAWKPSSKPFQTITQQLNVSAHQSVYIGDNPLKDFLGARKIGMFTIQYQIATGEYTKQKPPTVQHAPHLVVQGFVNLQKVLTEQDTIQ